MKHFSVRIWLALIVGGISSLWILPAFNAHFGLNWALAPASVVSLAAFSLTGWLLGRMGKQSLEALLKEAGSWERTGNLEQAKHTYQAAAACLESFLISPLLKRKLHRPLLSRMVRFYFLHFEDRPETASMVEAYLAQFPEDSEIAERWLGLLEPDALSDKLKAEIAVAVGDANAHHPVIQIGLARFYAFEERTDYQALLTYRRALENNTGDTRQLVSRLADVFYSQRRVDDRALDVYVRAYQQNPQKFHLVEAIGACAKRLHPTTGNAPLLRSAHAILGRFDSQRIQRMAIEFAPQEIPKEHETSGNRSRSFGNRLKRFAKLGFESTIRLSEKMRHVCISTMFSCIAYFRRSKTARIWLLRSGAAAAIIAIVLLGINTLQHLVKTEAPRIEKIAVVPEPALPRFSIQVAAFRKDIHAKQYAEKLLSKGLDAFWKKTEGEKGVYYKVVLGAFSSKREAEDTGNSLLAQKVIDDFYVTNYKGQEAE